MKGFASVEILLIGLVLLGLFGVLVPSTNKTMNTLSAEGRSMIEARKLIYAFKRAVSLATVEGIHTESAVVPADGNLYWGDGVVEYNFTVEGNVISVRGDLSGYNVSGGSKEVKAGSVGISAAVNNGTIQVGVNQ